MMTDRGMRRYLENAPIEVQDLMYDGNTMEAVKFLVERMSMTPREAIREVNLWEEQMRERFPEALPPRQPYYLGRLIIWTTLIIMLLAGIVAFIIISNSR